MDTRIPASNAFYDQIDPDTHDSPYDSTTPLFHAHAAAAVDVPGAAAPTLNADAPIVETLAAVDASSESLDPGMLLSSTTRRSPP